MADWRTADPSYFRAAGIPLVAGREFTATDRPGAARVVVVNRAFAERYFPNDDPIGKRVALTGEVLQFTPLSGDWRTIVGVVGTTQDGGLDKPARAVMFFPFAQELSFAGSFVVRSDSDPSLHHAMYQFTDKTALDRATGGPEMKRLVADFNRDWPDVTRTREVLVLAEELAA